MSAIGIGSEVSSLRDLGAECAYIRRLRYASPTVNKGLSLRDILVQCPIIIKIKLIAMIDNKGY